MKKPNATYRILSYNIHKGFSSQNSSFTLRKIKEALKPLNCDFVLLQEVQGEHKEWREKIDGYPLETQFEFLADSLWPHFAYGKNSIYRQGHHGNAILSRFPLTQWENHNISYSDLFSRSLLHAMPQDPETGQIFNLICLHLGLTPWERSRHLGLLRKLIAHLNLQSTPLVVAGDFNDWTPFLHRNWESSLGLKDVFENQVQPSSFPSWLPVFALDKAYVQNLRIQNARVLHDEPWKSLSDHLPLLFEVSL